jgi:hypothetical protein
MLTGKNVSAKILRITACLLLFKNNQSTVFGIGTVLVQPDVIQKNQA